MEQALSSALNLDSKLFDNTDSLLTNVLLFGIRQNSTILKATLEFILSTKGFDEPLFIS